VSVFWILLRYGKFTIERKDENLLITRGLLEKKQVTVPIQRIQAIGVEENLIRQPFGFVTVFAEIAGRSASEQLSDSTTLFPLLHRTELEPFLKEFAPDFAWKGENIQWDHPPRRALPYYIVRSSLIAAVAGLIIYFVFPFFIWAAGVLLFLSAVLGWLSFRDAGFSAESSGRLLIRYRLLKRVTVLLYHKRIQAYEKKQNPLERKEKLASMKISIISNRGGKHYQVKNLRDKSVNSVRDDLI
jgi:putative membrane protein